jgi:hypothetical protein
MFNGKFTRRYPGAAMAMVVGIGTASVVFAPPAAALHVEQYIEVPQCQPATSQVCPQSPEVRFTAGQNDQIQAQFTANGNHCSDILVRFNVDNYPQSDWLRASPGETVTSPTFTRSGDHVLSVTAQGVEGGCNTGVLNAWGGTVRIDSPDVVGPAPHPAADPAPPACKWTYSGAVVIMQDNGIRVDLDRWNDLYAGGPAHLYPPGSTVQANRGEIAGAGGEGTSLWFTIIWYGKNGGHADSNDYTGTIDPESGTLGGTTKNDEGVVNQWKANEHWTCS